MPKLSARVYLRVPILVPVPLLAVGRYARMATQICPTPRQVVRTTARGVGLPTPRQRPSIETIPLDDPWPVARPAATGW